jgi:hypothetical protein
LQSAVWLYETHGLFPNGKPFDEQDESFWQQMTITQRMNAYEMRVLRNDEDDMLIDEDELVEEPEPEPMTLDTM